MLPLLIVLTLMIVVFLPQFWTSRTIKKYSVPLDLPGTGGELAKHLINRFALAEVSVEQTEQGHDHYDPESKTIRLSEAHYQGKSLSAVTIAAHEFGHALQHHTNYPPLLLRTKLVKFVVIVEKIAAFILVGLPFSLLFKVPFVSILMLAAGASMMLLPIIVHVITLPVEFNASFKRALPILTEGHYLPEQALPIAHKILRAAALTYVAAALSSLVNFYRWVAIIRR